MILMVIGYRLLVIESLKFRVVESLALKVDSKICVFCDFCEIISLPLSFCVFRAFCETSNLEIYSAFMVIYFRMQTRVVLPYLR